MFEKSRYVYAGEVELADEPYMSDQIDARAAARFVWIFPLHLKATTEGAELYNVTADIGEKTNLADKNPDKLKELATLWDTWNAGNIDAAWGPGARKNAPNAQPGDPAQPRRKRNQPAN